MPDAAPASHAGNSCTDKITHPFYRLNLLPIPSYHSPRKGARPLCYFLGEKVTQKHFHTAAPLGRQCESAFARSRGGSPEPEPAAAVSRCSRPALAGASAPSPAGSFPDFPIRQTGSYQTTKLISFSFPDKFQCKKQSSCKQALSLAWQPTWLCPHNSVGFPPALQFLQINIEELRRKTFAKKRPMLCSLFHLFPAGTAKGRPVMSTPPHYMSNQYVRNCFPFACILFAQINPKSCCAQRK